MTNTHPQSNAMLELEAKVLERVADMKVSQALDSGLVHRCPTCRIIHAGIRYMHEDHRNYCSTYCFQNRKER